MFKIFISYRRDDSLPWTGRLHEHLARSFGTEHVFIDIDSIKPGEDFSDVVSSHVEECDVFVPVIGKHWLAITDASGTRRLDNDQDYVRKEISAAIQHHKRIVPVFVAGASMPDRRELPSEISALATKNGFAIDDLRFADDVRRLIQLLTRETSGPSTVAGDITTSKDLPGKTHAWQSRREDITGLPNVRSQLKNNQPLSGIDLVSSSSWYWAVGAVVIALLAAWGVRIGLRDETKPSHQASISAQENKNAAGLSPSTSPAVDADTTTLQRGIDSYRQHSDMTRPAGVGKIKPNLGMILEPVSDHFAKTLGLSSRKGAMISEVARGGVADRAGLRRGDVVVRLNSKIVSNDADFEQRLDNMDPGGSANLDVWRVLQSDVETFTIVILLPSQGQTESVTKSIDKRVLEIQEASELMKKYDDIAKATIKQIR